MLRLLKSCLLLSGVLIVISPSLVVAALPSTQDISDQQQIREQERQRALQESLSPKSPDIRLLSDLPSSNTMTFPEESPCFVINHIELLERDKLPWYMPLTHLVRQAENRCLGSEGINILMTELQDRLVSYGFITTRVVVPEQDISEGTLQLLLVEGKVRHIYYSDESDRYAQLYTAMPAREGQTLNLRDIEQGLENLQRLPTVNAEMKLVPGDEPGETDIVITRKQSKFWRFGLSLDDSGTRTTGRYQGGATLFLDNLLSLSDSFYASGGHDLDHKGKYGSRNYLLSYSVPFGYWSLNASLNGNKYHQTVAGSVYDYKYSGRSRQANFQLSRIIHRNESQKTTLYYGVTLRESHNYIDDTEVEVQRRKTTYWTLGLYHRHYFGNVTLDIGASYKKGVRWFNAEPAPEEYGGYGSALVDIFNTNVSVNVPFTIASQQFRYQFDYQGQFTRGNNLTPPDRFSIGSRWTVRGFDGELNLSADNGWFVRNDLAWVSPLNNEVYLGLDYGQVSGAHSGYLLGKKLAGAALGIRGNAAGFYYDAFIGAPLYKPTGFRTNDVVLGFTLNWNY